MRCFFVSRDEPSGFILREVRSLYKTSKLGLRSKTRGSTGGSIFVVIWSVSRDCRLACVSGELLVLSAWQRRSHFTNGLAAWTVREALSRHFFASISHDISTRSLFFSSYLVPYSYTSQRSSSRRPAVKACRCLDAFSNPGCLSVPSTRRYW
jgi:hypothetical protein